MTDVTRGAQRRGPKRAIRFWFLWLFVAATFLAATHHRTISISRADYYQPEQLRAVSEGDLHRRIGFGLLGVVGLLELARRGIYRFQGSRMLFWLAVFYVIWAHLSLLWSINQALTIRRLVILTIFYLSSLAMARIFSLREIAFATYWISLFFVLLGFVVELSLGTFEPGISWYRFYGTQHPNHQGTACALLIIGALTMSVIRPTKKFRYWIAIAIGMAFLVLTKSRTSFMSTILCCFFFWGMLTSDSKKRLISIGLLTALIGGLFLVGDLVVETGISVLFLGRYVEDEAVTLTGRIPLWTELLEYSKQRPLTGFGYGSFWTPEHVEDITASQGWEILTSHSIWLETLVQLGAFGLSLVILLFGVAFSTALQHFLRIRRAEMLFLGTVILFSIINGATETVVIEPTFLMFVVAIGIAKLALTPPDAPQNGEFI